LHEDDAQHERQAEPEGQWKRAGGLPGRHAETGRRRVAPARRRADDDWMPRNSYIGTVRKTHCAARVRPSSGWKAVHRIVSLLIAAAIAWAPAHAGARMRCDTLGTAAPVHCCCPASKAANDPALSCCTRSAVTERDAARAAAENAPQVAPPVFVVLVPQPVAPRTDVAAAARAHAVGTEPIGPPLPLRV
jgi:hypothetical protein